MGLTTVAQVKTYLTGIGEAIPTGQDALVQFIIDAVAAQVEEFCRRKFDQATYTEIHTGHTGQQHLFPNQWPIGTITSVKIDGAVITEGTNGDNYRKFKSGAGDVIALFREDGWASDPMGVEIVYQGGYASGAIPKDLEQAVVRLVVDDYLHRGKQGMSNESFQGLSLTFDHWPASVVMALRKHQKPLI